MMKRIGKEVFRFAPAAGLGVALLAIGLTGCKSFFTAVNDNPTGTGTSTYVYVANQLAGGGGSLAAYSLSGGVLTALSGSPYSLAATPTSVVVAPNNAFLFVGTDLGVFLYTIASDGTLTEGNNNTIVYLGPTYPVSLAVDSTSSWLIIANQNSTELDALPIAATTGVPTSSTPASTILTAATPLGVTISPANTNVFVAMGASGASAVSFTASDSSDPWGKTLVNIPLLKTGGSVTGVAVDSTSTYLFLTESTTNMLRLFTIANLAKDTADYATGNGPSAVLNDLSGAFVYVANQTDNTISAFTLSAGALTAQADSPFATAKTPVALAENGAKTDVLAIGLGANPNLWVYGFDSTTAGTLDVAVTTSTGTTDPALSNAIAVTH